MSINVNIVMSIIVNIVIIYNNVDRDLLNSCTDDVCIIASGDKHFMLDWKTLKSSKVYILMTISKCEAPTAKIKFQSVIDGINWNTVCGNIYKTAIDTYSREFQFRIIHNYLNVNVKLYKWKLIETCLCSYCFTEPETIAHLFCDCFIVKNLYFKVVEWKRSYHIYLPSVSESSIVF